MRLPIIKSLVAFARERDTDFLLETAETLECLADLPSLKEDELDVIGELLSNIYGSTEVIKMIDNGAGEKEALNSFMNRVLGSIDKL